jgi:hypothetical protein
MAHGREDSFLVVLYLWEAVIRNKSKLCWNCGRLQVVLCTVKKVSDIPAGDGNVANLFCTEWEEYLLVLYTAKSRLVTG